MFLRSGLARAVLVASAAALPGILLLSHPVVAQEPQRGETVTSRARPELDPLGARVGSFLFFPQFSVEGRYDDNLYATDTNEVDDTITVVRPEVQLRSNWSNHALNFVAGAEAGYYSKNDSEDYLDYFAGADTRLDVARGSRLLASVKYLGLHEERGFPEGEGGAEPTEYTLLTTGADYRHQFNRFSVGLGGRFNRYTYEDGISAADPSIIIYNNVRDRDSWQGTLRLGYEVSPGLEFYARGTYFAVAYDVKPIFPDFDRDSTGYEAVAGTAFDVTGVTFGELFAGYRSREPDDSRFERIDGAQFGGAVTWNPSGLTTVRGEIARSVEETTLTGSPGFLATRYGLAVDHELLRNLLLGLNGSYTTRDYQEIGREDDYVRGGMYAKYLMNRHLYISFNYRYADRRSNQDQDYVKNVYMLRLQTQY